MIEDQIDTGPRRESREALDRLKQQMGHPVCPRPFQCEPDLSVSCEFEPLLRNGRAQGIVAHALQAVPLPGADRGSLSQLGVIVQTHTSSRGMAECPK